MLLCVVCAFAGADAYYDFAIGAVAMRRVERMLLLMLLREARWR